MIIYFSDDQNSKTLYALIEKFGMNKQFKYINCQKLKKPDYIKEIPAVVVAINQVYQGQNALNFVYQLKNQEIQPYDFQTERTSSYIKHDNVNFDQKTDVTNCTQTTQLTEDKISDNELSRFIQERDQQTENFFIH